MAKAQGNSQGEDKQVGLTKNKLTPGITGKHTHTRLHVCKHTSADIPTPTCMHAVYNKEDPSYRSERGLLTWRWMLMPERRALQKALYCTLVDQSSSSSVSMRPSFTASSSTTQSCPATPPPCHSACLNMSLASPCSTCLIMSLLSHHSTCLIMSLLSHHSTCLIMSLLSHHPTCLIMSLLLHHSTCLMGVHVSCYSTGLIVSVLSHHSIRVPTVESLNWSNHNNMVFF